MLAEEVYLLDNKTYIEIDNLPASEDTLPSWGGLRAFRRLEKEVQYFVSLPPRRGLFIPGGSK